MRVACENGVNTGLECRDMGKWRACDVCIHCTKIWIEINAARYRADMM